MRRPRPYIPMAVRAKVVLRMLEEKTDWASDRKADAIWVIKHLGSDAKRIEIGLDILGLSGAELDHDPALILRDYNPRIKNVAARYSPNANDPAALVYREDGEHQQKTTGRKPGAERTVTTKGSDIGIKTKFARLERKAKRPRPRGFNGGRKMKIPSRPFPKRKP